MVIIEIELTENGRPIKDDPANGSLQLAHDNLILEVIGYLCTKHVNLPSTVLKKVSGNYVFQIYTCCEESRQFILKRLQENHITNELHQYWKEMTFSTAEKLIVIHEILATGMIVLPDGNPPELFRQLEKEGLITLEGSDFSLKAMITTAGVKYIWNNRAE